MLVLRILYIAAYLYPVLTIMIHTYIYTYACIYVATRRNVAGLIDICSAIPVAC